MLGVHAVKSHCELVVFILLVEIELNWSWISVPVFGSPSLVLALHLLERVAIMVHVV